MKYTIPHKKREILKNKLKTKVFLRGINSLDNRIDLKFLPETEIIGKSAILVKLKIDSIHSVIKSVDITVIYFSNFKSKLFSPLSLSTLISEKKNRINTIMGMTEVNSLHLDHH